MSAMSSKSLLTWRTVRHLISAVAGDHEKPHSAHTEAGRSDRFLARFWLLSNQSGARKATADAQPPRRTGSSASM
jgi:hypothetical protein